MRVACVLGPGFEDSEFRVPYDRFRQAGHPVVIVGTKQGEQLTGYRGKEGAIVEMGIDDADPEMFDALFIPGGYSPDHLRGDVRVIRFVRAFREKPILCICHGPQLLITADMVRGRTVTAWKTVQIDLRNAGARVVDDEVVVEGNLVTSRSPADLEPFCREALHMLESAQPEARI
jgi:protease I